MTHFSVQSQRAMLHDRFGRTIRYLRISLTDRCNFRCVYCMPEVGVAFRPKAEILTFEEITRLARIFNHLGVTKFRLTGGEPLLRRELPKLLRMLKGIGDDIEIYLTTNGYLLGPMAAELKDCGVDGLNVSLDTLRPDRFFEIARRHYFQQVWEGIEAALRVGFTPLKINSVLMRGTNDDEIEDFARWTRDTPVHIRFIEYMPYRDNRWEAQKVVSGLEVAQRLAELHPEAPWFEGLETDGISSLVKIPGHAGAIGFINPMTDKFCSTCNRVRLTADGKLRLCLFSELGTDLRTLLRSEIDDEEIATVIERVVYRLKPATNPLPDASRVDVQRYMVEVGG